jgi:hypothetical protein
LFFLAGRIGRERQPNTVLLQQYNAGIVEVAQEVAELAIGLQGCRKNDIDEGRGKPLQSALPPFGILIGQVCPDEHSRVFVHQLVEEDPPGSGARRTGRLPHCSAIAPARSAAH